MKIDLDISLLTNDENKALRFSSFESLGSGSYKCKVVLNSSGFCYDNDMYFEDLENFVTDLGHMNSKLNGEAKLKEFNHEHYISFKLNDLGHLIVSGLLIEYSEHSQKLQFEFITDQTCLSGLLQGFRKLL